MRGVVVVNLEETAVMHQDYPINFVYTQIYKATTTKSTLWIYANNVSIISMNST